MSGIPPHLDADPGTPAGEWAKSTTTAAFARSDLDPTPKPAPGVSTEASLKRPIDPKQSVSQEDVPGAYPAAADTGTHSGPQVSVKDSAVHAAEVGYAYAASAASTAASYLPRGVVDTVSSYMPTSHATSTMSTARASEHDVQHKTSLPTTEYGGAGSHEHIGGVGSLPGPMNEQGVAKLPDENNGQERYLTTGAAVGAAGAAIAAGAYATKEAVVGNPGQKKGTAEVEKGPADPATQHQHATSVTSSTLPSHEPLGAQPGDHSMGAGALPGNQSEPHVARLPEESLHPQYDSGNVDTAAQVCMKPSEELHGNEAATGDVRHVGGVGALVGDQSEVSVAKTPEERQREHYHEVGPRGDPGSGVTGPIGIEGAVIERKDEPEHKAGAHHEHHHKHHHSAEGAAVAGVGAAAAAGTHHAKDKDSVPHQEEGDPMREAKGEGAKEGGGAKEREGVKEGAKDNEKAKATAAAGAAPKSGDHGNPNKGSGYQTDYHPAEIHPGSETAGKPASSQAAEGEKSLGATQADASRPPEEQKPPHVQQETQTHKKATFMEKMKGEAKVLMGKIEGKQEKVAEGERMKHPEAKASPTEAQKATQATSAEAAQEQAQTAPAEQQKQPQA